MHLIPFLFIDVPPPNLMKQGNDNSPFYSDLRVVIPLAVLIVAIIFTIVGAIVCMRRRKWT